MEDDDVLIWPDFTTPVEELNGMLLEWIQREWRPRVAELVPPDVAAHPTMAARLIDQNIATILRVVAGWFELDGTAGTEPGQ